MIKNIFLLMAIVGLPSINAMKPKDAHGYDVKLYLKNQELHQGPITRAALNEIDFEGEIVLDVGCGPGHHCTYMADKGAAVVVGIDPSKRMIEYAKENNNVESITSYENVSAEEFTKKEASFDIITCSFVFPYIKKNEQESVLKKFYEMLSPGGTLLIIMPAQDMKSPLMLALGRLYQNKKDDWGNLITKLNSQVHQVYKPTEYKQMLIKAGFSEEVVEQGVKVCDAPMKVTSSEQFEEFTNSWSRGAYPAIRAMSKEEYKAFTRDLYDAYYQVRKRQDPEFDKDGPFLHPYKLFVMKVRKEA